MSRQAGGANGVPTGPRFSARALRESERYGHLLRGDGRRQLRAGFKPTALVRKGSTRAIAARLYLNAKKTKATLDPDRKLRPGATYVATLRAGAKDEAGNALATGKTWRFTIKR